MDELASIRTRIERRAWPIVAGLVALGLLLLAVNGPFSSVRDYRIVQFVDRVLVVLAAAVVYARVRSDAPGWEVLAVAGWILFVIPVAGTFGYFAFAGLAGPHPGATAELINDAVRFLQSVAAVGGLCAAGAVAARRGRRLLAGLALLAVPVGLFLVYGVVSAFGA